jgi:mRNA-degrading endonuclease RelE of RelBE toxin-antitoxin system
LHLETTKTFSRLYRKLPAEVKERVREALVRLESNPAHPSLGHKKMQGQEDIYEIRVSDTYRITYQKVGETAFLRKVGTHDMLRRP